MTDPATGDINRLLEILTRAHTVTTRGPHGELYEHEQHGLIAALRAAKTSSYVRGSGSSALDHERNPGNVAAIDLYRDVERTVRRWARDARLGTAANRPDLEHLLALWAHAADWHELTRRIPQLRDWIRQITDLLDPPPRWALDFPCPHCGNRWATIGSRTHRERVDALQVTARTADDHEIACRSCGTVWIGLHGAEALNRLLTARSTA